MVGMQTDCSKKFGRDDDKAFVWVNNSSQPLVLAFVVEKAQAPTDTVPMSFMLRAGS